MSSPNNKTVNTNSTSRTSRQTSRVFSSGSEESVFEKSHNRKYSFAAYETITRLNLKRGSVAENNNRRTSVPFPVTELASKWRKSAKSDGDETVRNNLLKHSRSDGLLQEIQRNGPESWRVLQVVYSAKRKFSGGEILAQRNKRLSLFDVLRFSHFSRAEIQKRKMVRLWKQKARQKKNLLAKFRMAVKLTIFCARNFKEHCLRINADKDELAPFIKQLHFHEDNTPDLLIDLTQFKANRQLRIPEETKRILSKEVGQRTEQEIYSVTIALRNIKSIGDYPNRMQKKIAEVGLYEKYEAKRIIVRQGHPASGFYFILSGAVVVMVMDMESKYARPVAHLYKGQTFGELAIVNRTVRKSTVIAKETCEFLSISVQDYHKIFMDGGVKNINDPDQEIFLKSLSYLSDWPIHIMKDHPTKCKFLFFKRDEVIVADSHQLDWVIIVKSGSVQVLKKLKKCEAFEWRRNTGNPEPMNTQENRELAFQRSEWRRILPEISVPLNDPEEADEVMLNTGRPQPFRHPDKHSTEQMQEKKKPKIPNLWPFSVDLSDVEFGKYVEDDLHFSKTTPSIQIQEPSSKGNDDRHREKPLNTSYNTVNSLGVYGHPRRKSVLEEEEKELLGFRPHIRTIMEELDIGVQDKVEKNPEDENPEFVHVQTLTKGQAFGFADMFVGDQPSFSVISKGADCLLINKQFYQEHATEKLLREVRQNLCPFPSDEELQKGLQLSVDWNAFRRLTLNTSLEKLSLRRLMRTDLRGTKVQEAFT